MSDKQIFNVRQRPLSTDHGDAQSIAQRTQADLLRYALFREHSPVLASPAVTGVKSAVVGLDLSSTNLATFVTLQPGLLMQDSSTIAPVPGVYDSTYRVAFNRSLVQITCPVPGANTWYLLEAQMVEVTSSSNTLDILNPSTRRFESAIVPTKKEWRVTTQWKAGSSSQIPAPDPDWVPLWAYLIDTSGRVSATDQRDLRPLLHHKHQDPFVQHWSRGGQADQIVTVATPGGAVSELVRVQCGRAITNSDLGSSDMPGGGLILSWQTRNASDVASLDLSATGGYKDPATTYSADTWYYLYLAPWFDSAPSGDAGGLVQTAGVLVVSATTPANRKFNSAAITLPAPYSNYTVPVGQAPCIGAIRRNHTNDGWVPMHGGNGRYMVEATGNASNLGIWQGGATGGTSSTITLSLLPATALSGDVRAFFHPSGSIAAAELWGIDVRPGGGSIWDTTGSFTVPTSEYQGDWALTIPNASGATIAVSRGAGTATVGTFSVWLRTFNT